MKRNNKHREFNKIKILSTRCNFCIKKYKKWRDWANCINAEVDSDGRKEAILKSRSTRAIKQLDWSIWVNAHEGTADYKKIQILRSHRDAAISQITNWGTWANTDERKTQLLKSQCKTAIEQVTGWDDWANPDNANTTDQRKSQILRSQCVAAIAQVTYWDVWANTDAKKEQILKSRSKTAIEQVTGWGAWANTNDRKKQVFNSRCADAIRQVQETNSSNTTNRLNSNGCTAEEANANHQVSSADDEEAACDGRGQADNASSAIIAERGFFGGHARRRNHSAAGLPDDPNSDSPQRVRAQI